MSIFITEFLVLHR